MRYFNLLTVCWIATLFSGQIFAQATVGGYPIKPVTMIVTYAAGGPNDIEARLYATKMSELMAQSFVLDFKPGAGTTIGTAYVAKAAPDGYTLLVVSASFVAFPALYKDLTFDTIRHFAPISLMSQKANAVLVIPSFPAKSIAEYVSYAKANPGKINFGTTGVGGISHLAGAWLHSASDTKVTFVHYKGSPALSLDLMAGRVEATTTALFSALPQIKAGKLRALAVTDERRSKLLPELPTAIEQGIPGYSYSNWTGFAAPGATPTTIVNKLSDAFAKIAKTSSVIASLEADGATAVGSTSAQFRQLIVTETENWRKVVLNNGIKLDD